MLIILNKTKYSEQMRNRDISAADTQYYFTINLQRLMCQQFKALIPGPEEKSIYLGLCEFFFSRNICIHLI